MMDLFSHRILYLLGAGQPLDELHEKYMEDRYKRTMLGLPREKREEVCAHPEQFYPEYRKRWEADWQKKVNEMEKIIKKQRLEQLMVRTLLKARLKGTGIQFRITHQDDKVKVVYSMPKRKEAVFSFHTPTKDTIELITKQVIEAHRGGPLSPSAKIGPRSIYGVWESADQ